MNRVTLHYIVLALTAILLLGANAEDNLSTKSDVKAFYQAQTLPSGTIALNSSSESVDIQTLLVPITLDAGNYAITVTRKGQDIYLIDGKNIYIKTSYCYEYSYTAKATLKVTSTAGYTKGVLTFIK